MALDVAAFQKRLDEISNHRGTPFGRVHLMFEEEEKHAQACLKYNGYLHLSDAFKSLFLESTELLNTEIAPKVKTKLSEFIRCLWPVSRIAFERCAARNAFHFGATRTTGTHSFGTPLTI